MMFNNAESVYIDGKEVDAIITADGGVLYEKNPSYDLTLSCTKDILSLHDNDSCILTGVLTLNGLPVSDETVNYSIMHNDTILDGGTLVSDINGEISLEYFAAGAGNVNVIFSLRSLLQKTYAIEDCINTIIPDTQVSSKTGDVTFLEQNVDTDFIITGDYYPTDPWEWFMFNKTNNGTREAIIGVFSSSYDKANNFGITNIGINAWKHIQIKWENNTLTFKYGDITVSRDVSQYSYPFTIGLMVNRITRVKNLKIKKL